MIRGIADHPFEPVRSLFLRARDLPPDERADFLREACRSDVGLQREVESLLANDDGSVLDGPILGRSFHPAALLAEVRIDDLSAPDEPAPDIPRYRILGPLGAGGMGTVWDAEQADPRRRVAVKVLRDATTFNPAHLYRFRAEASALARLDHAAIVRIIEAGRTSDGRPFIAMERVMGVPLDRWADQRRRALPPAAFRRTAITLFISLADAIDQAHRCGIVHRDLKPSNILVEAGDRPRVLDFGLARSADPADSRVTQAGSIMGTLPWMSPEQVRGSSADIDGRTDVHALGLLLYHVLTGHPPYTLAGRSLPEAARIICECDAPPAGRYDRALRCDIEIILGVALAKDPARRFPTAAALAADLRCVLQCRPISARRPSPLYLLSRFVGRHRLASALLVLLLAALTAFGAIGASLATAATRARDLAQRESARHEIVAYRHGIALAQLLHDQRDVTTMSRVLETCPPGQRGWEWGWLRRLATETDRVIDLPGARLVVETPHGPRFLACTTDGAFLHDEDDATPAVRLNGAPADVTAWAIDPTGTRIAAGDRRGTIRLFDTATGARHWHVEAIDGPVGALAFNRDGTRIAAGIGFTPPAAPPVDARYPGRRLAIISAPDGGLRAVHRAPNQIEPVAALAFTEDDAALLVASGRRVTVLDAHNGAGPSTIAAADEGITSLVIVPGRRMFVTGHRARAALDGTVPSGSVRLWHQDGPTLVREITRHPRGVLAVAVGRDGRTLLSANGNDTLRVTDLDSGRGHEVLRADVHALGILGDGGEVWSIQRDRRVRLCRPDPAEVDHRLGADHPAITAAALSTDGSWAVTGDGRGRVMRHRLDMPGIASTEIGRHTAPVTSLAIAATTQHILSGHLDGAVLLWAADGGAAAPPRRPAPGAAVRSLAIAPDGGTVVAGDARGAAHAWRSLDMPDGWQCTLSAHEGAVQAIAVDWPRGIVFTGAADGTIRTWTIPDGRCTSVRPGHDGEITSLAYSARTQRLASGGTDARVLLWDALHPAGPPHVLDGHRSTVLAVAFTPDGSRLASSSTDTTVRIWAPQESEAFLALPWQGRPAPWLAFDAAGQTLTALDPSGLARRRSAMLHGGPH